jgi:hypothetical protein
LIGSAGRSINRKPVITKEFILSRISEIAIFEHYLCIPVQYDTFVSSPLRDNDTHPSCKFKQLDSYIGFKDFTGHFQGDCFKAVEFMYGLNFREAWVKIAQDFGLTDGNNSIGRVTNKAYSKVVRKKAVKATIEISSRKWSRDDLEFWSAFGISTETLSRFNVKPCSVIWLNKKWSYTNDRKNPAYAYYFGRDEYKIYFPLKPKGLSRFWSNGDNLQGINQLDLSRPDCIITKSLKDVMSLYELGYNAVAPPAEGALVKPEWMEYLCLSFREVIVLFDNDETGMEWAKKNSSTYNVPYIYLNPKEGVKDISDYRKSSTKEATKEKLVAILQIKNYDTSI